MAGLLLAFVVFALFQKGLNMTDFIKNQLLISSDKSMIIQHILFQGIVQLVFIILFILLLTKWKHKKYAFTAIMMIFALDVIVATRLNGPYTVYYDQLRTREIHEYARQFPEGFPIPGTGPVLDNRDSGKLIYQALWRNLNIFHKQISYEGYNPVHLKGFEEMADNHPRLFETILQNTLVYLTDKVSPLDSLPLHEKDSNYLKNRVYLPMSIIDCIFVAPSAHLAFIASIN